MDASIQAILCMALMKGFGLIQGIELIVVNRVV
jgi:hypothetical protein